MLLFWRSHGDGQKLTRSKEMLTVLWNKKTRDVQKIKDILTKEFTYQFSRKIDKKKLYNIISGPYTSNGISESLLTIFGKGKYTNGGIQGKNY